MGSKEIAGIAGIVAIAEAILLFCIPAFWRAGASMGHVVGTVILSAHWISGFVSWIMALFLLLMLVVAGVALLVLGYLAVVRLLQKISAGLQDLAARFDALSAQLSRNARDTAIDAGFVVVLGMASALVAYLSTEDFLAKMSLLRILAVAAMCYAAFKAAMLIPIRSTQIMSGVLMIGILAASIALLHHRHPLYPLGDPTGVAHWFAAAEPPQVTAACAIIVLSALSLLYPFTWRGWKRILTIS